MIIRDFAERCNQELGRLGLTLATDEEIALGRALAARTVSPDIATVATLLAASPSTRTRTT